MLTVTVEKLKELDADFDTRAIKLFDHLLGSCANVEWLPRKKRSDQAYLEAGQRIVDCVDYLVAVWDGLPAAGKGGTGDAVAYARHRGVPVLVVDPRPFPALPAEKP